MHSYVFVLKDADFNGNNYENYYPTDFEVYELLKDRISIDGTHVIEMDDQECQSMIFKALDYECFKSYFNIESKNNFNFITTNIDEDEYHQIQLNELKELINEFKDFEFEDYYRIKNGIRNIFADDYGFYFLYNDIDYGNCIYSKKELVSCFEKGTTFKILNKVYDYHY